MATVFDVARYILEKRGPMSAMKLQKLCYYAQAWSLVWDTGEPLFDEDFQAWAFGPVVPELYQVHRGQFQVNESMIVDGNSGSLTSAQKENIDVVLDAYGAKPAHWLSELTHREKPWKAARGGLPPGASSETTISKESMQRYYDSLVDATPVRDMAAD